MAPGGSDAQPVSQQPTSSSILSGKLKDMMQSLPAGGKGEVQSIQDYIEEYSILPLVKGMVRALLDSKPRDPVHFLIGHLKKQVPPGAGDTAILCEAPEALQKRPRFCTEEVLQEAMRDYANMPGLGEAGSSASGFDPSSSELPDLKKHKCVGAVVLRNEPELWDMLKAVRTKHGISLGHCIKPAMDVHGHAMIKTGGVCAGDAESYEAFQAFFDPMLRKLHSTYTTDMQHPASDWKGEAEAGEWRCSKDLPSLGNNIIHVRLRLGRNLADLPFTTGLSATQRQEVEQRLVAGLLKLEAKLDGNYYPLRASATYPGRPQGMTEAEEKRLQEAGVLLLPPTSALVLASSAGRNWPHARGVFTSRSGQLTAWVNSEEDHLCLFLKLPGDSLAEAYADLCKAEAQLHHGVAGSGGFAHSRKLGYLSAFPENLGTNLRVEVSVRLPLLGAAPVFRSECKRLGLRPHRNPQVGEDVWVVSNNTMLGSSERQQVALVAKGVQELLQMEADLSRNKCLSEH
eukprot:TRINITY_DN23211_c0_g1_i1.p1 TRINITY_DN23211_c0_g1~~TRINITY_DN23211_c0_g1_i1.p1  ORF type:complete len:535 (-),score=110.70 TRINITY_DN23211_c0_g1_i1:205-1746(-)